jgi:CheY-like chemotaxis protein
MGILTLYDILQDIVSILSEGNPEYRNLPTELEPDALIFDLGLNSENLPAILGELKIRLEGRDVNILASIPEPDLKSLTLKRFLKLLQESIVTAVLAPIVVYVDDEEENIFVFKRYFGKALRLVTFTDPESAFDFIRKESAVALVITDQVMPKLNGTALCNAIRRTKPFLKFILLTGNPAGDSDLMYSSLRHGKFHDFISKPLDLQKRGPEYLEMIQSLLKGPESDL